MRTNREIVMRLNMRRTVCSEQARLRRVGARQRRGQILLREGVCERLEVEHVIVVLPSR